MKALVPKHPATVVDLAEYALELWEDSIEHIDDSDGGMGMILDDLHQLHYLQIAEHCRQVGRNDLALQWGAEGVRAFPGHGDTRLHEFLAEQYVREGRPEDAVQTAWDVFAAQPC